MSDQARRAEAIVGAMLERDAFSRWLGVEVLDLAVGRCRCRMRVREEMVNGFGVAHGGIAFSLADSALAFASNAQGRITLSIENGIAYPASIRPGDTLTATATEESAGNRIAFYLVRVTNQRDEMVALFRGTVYRTGEQHP
ncbi:MAG: hotdog fold thioesterase [Gemmatimonadales bacterium]